MGTVQRGDGGRGKPGDLSPALGGVCSLTPSRKGAAPTTPHPRSPRKGASGIPARSRDLQSRPRGRPHPARSTGSSQVRDPRGPGADTFFPPRSLTCAAAAASASRCAPGSALRKLQPGPLPQRRLGGGADTRGRPISGCLPVLTANPRRPLRVDPTETFHRDPSSSPGSSRLPPAPRSSGPSRPA
ncbi:uncharacterized protein LOC144336761 [Macaca mulatta]